MVWIALSHVRDSLLQAGCMKSPLIQIRIQSNANPFIHLQYTNKNHSYRHFRPQETENLAETTVTKIQPENPLSLYLPDLKQMLDVLLCTQPVAQVAFPRDNPFSAGHAKFFSSSHSWGPLYFTSLSLSPIVHVIHLNTVLRIAVTQLWEMMVGQCD